VVLGPGFGLPAATSTPAAAAAPELDAVSGGGIPCVK